MAVCLDTLIAAACQRVDHDPGRLLDVLHVVQSKVYCISDEAIDIIAKELDIPRVRIDGAVTFYAFLSKTPKGQITIRLSSDIIDKLHGADEVAKAFASKLGIRLERPPATANFRLSGPTALACVTRLPPHW